MSLVEWIELVAFDGLIMFYDVFRQIIGMVIERNGLQRREKRLVQYRVNSKIDKVPKEREDVDGQKT